MTRLSSPVGAMNGIVERFWRWLFSLVRACLITRQVPKNQWTACARHVTWTVNRIAALQVADMFTKQIFPKHFERLRRVMMGHENFDDMCERYQDAKAAGDDVDDPKLYTVKPVRPPNG